MAVTHGEPSAIDGTEMLVSPSLQQLGQQDELVVPPNTLLYSLTASSRESRTLNSSPATTGTVLKPKYLHNCRRSSYLHMSFLPPFDRIQDHPKSYCTPHRAKKPQNSLVLLSFQSLSLHPFVLPFVTKMVFPPMGYPHNSNRVL